MAFVPAPAFPSAKRFTPALSPRRAPTMSAEPSSTDGKRGILMLCLGNICRSPAAEAVMKGVLTKRNMSDSFFVDSCGTGGGYPNWYKENGRSYHEGGPPDERMQAAAERRGIVVDGASRPLHPDDFDRFDMIVAMDDSNLENIDLARRYWGINNPHAQISLLSSFSPDEGFRGRAVPDPYYSGPAGFDYALDLIENSCDGLADHLANNS